MSATQIRRATSPELESLGFIIEDLINSLPYYNNAAKKNEIDKYCATELQKKMEQDSDSVLVAYANNKIVGFCLSRFDDMLIWLEWFAVIETERKKGIARQLLKHLESTVNSRKAHKIWCDCRIGNIKSINILSSSGYIPICSVKNHWYGQDFIIWQKEIL